MATASDIKYYALPDLQSRLERLEAKLAEETAQGDSDSNTVTSEHIAEIVAKWTNIPVTRLMSTEKDKLLNIERVLKQEVVGQPDAIKAVANAIRLSRSGLANANRPIASFLFSGPSGSGKTQLSKTVRYLITIYILKALLTCILQLAQLLFDSPDAMIRLDGSEYSEKHAISRCIGSPPGYVGHAEGGQLTVRVYNFSDKSRDSHSLFRNTSVASLIA